MNKPTKEQLNEIELKYYTTFINESWAKKYFTMEAGKEHYRLLYHLASKLPDGESIVELGTFMGHSALALGAGANESVNITTFDIVNKVDCDLMPNTTFELVAEGKFKKTALKAASLIFVDTFHDGEMENFWNGINVRKEDWTDIGHWSGTGIVFFD